MSMIIEKLGFMLGVLGNICFFIFYFVDQPTWINHVQEGSIVTVGLGITNILGLVSSVLLIVNLSLVCRENWQLRVSGLIIFWLSIILIGSTGI